MHCTFKNLFSYRDEHPAEGFFLVHSAVQTVEDFALVLAWLCIERAVHCALQQALQEALEPAKGLTLPFEASCSARDSVSVQQRNQDPVYPGSDAAAAPLKVTPVLPSRI